MTRPGPSKLPTAIKALRGETRAERLNAHEPKPRPNLPKMPATMSEPARKVWRLVMRNFGETGVITAVDGEALRVYCEAVVRYEYSAELLEKAGPLIRGARQGEMVKNPLNQVVRDNADLMRAYARELGLTPGARAELSGGVASGNSTEQYDLASLPSAPPEPKEAILEALRVASWKEAALRARLDTDPNLAGAHHNAVELLARIAKSAADMGINERAISLEERHIRLVLTALMAGLDAIPGLSHASRELAETAAGQVLLGPTPASLAAMPVGMELR